MGKCSTVRVATAPKRFFQANLQMRSLISDNFQKKKISNEIFMLGYVRLSKVRKGSVRLG
jgi:hypothetical protein